MFTNYDIVDYYDSTFVHYKRWWSLSEAFALHYGIWDKGVRNFSQSLINTNKVLMEIGQVHEGDRVLDAGCGIGGSSLFLASNKNIEAVGISLSDRQVAEANQIALKKGLNNRVSFYKMDYTQTSFPDASFDVVWACESMCHAFDKEQFINECFRLLKKGGRLILCDYFLTSKGVEDKKKLIQRWREVWSINNFAILDDFKVKGRCVGFKNVSSFNYTAKILRTSRIYLYFSLLGTLPSLLYNLTHPKVSRFGKTHYKSGYLQYLALKEKLWEYHIVLMTK